MHWEGIQFYLRYNFHNWKVSVLSERPIEVDFEDCFKDEDCNSCYFEGFDSKWVHGSYYDNPKKFSVELHGHDDLIFFFKNLFAVPNLLYSVSKISKFGFIAPIFLYVT